MYKKITMFLLLIATCSINAMLRNTQNRIPYENIIEAEYNLARPGRNRYTSIHNIMNQPFYSQHYENKQAILDDMRALQRAIQVALNTAETQSTRLWYYGYLWRDNETTIQTLKKWLTYVTTMLTNLELEALPLYSIAQKHLDKATEYAAIAGLTILTLYASQWYLDENHNSLLAMLSAPTRASLALAAQALFTKSMPKK